ncbi:MAG: lamin tail domain-containing protein [Fidelibacterota bacterium]
MKKRGFVFIAALMFVSISTFATVVTTSDSVVINEFTYNSEYYDNEWIELYNISKDTVNIVGWSLMDGYAGHNPAVIPNTCPDTLLEPGEYFTI